MKKALSLILCLAMALALLPPGAAAAEGSPFDGGSGTAGNSAGRNTEGKNQRDGKDDSPFSDIDG